MSLNISKCKENENCTRTKNDSAVMSKLSFSQNNLKKHVVTNYERFCKINNYLRTKGFTT